MSVRVLWTGDGQCIKNPRGVDQTSLDLKQTLGKRHDWLAVCDFAARAEMLCSESVCAAARLVGPDFLELCDINEWREAPNDIETFRLQTPLRIRERNVRVVLRYGHDVSAAF